jgi:hypothetical protein
MGDNDYEVESFRSSPVEAGVHYIRQSALAQVRLDQESTDRQYNLMNKALSLGWKSGGYRVLDRESRPIW